MVTRSAISGSSTSAKPGCGCGIAGSPIHCRTTSGGCRKTTWSSASKGCWTSTRGRTVRAAGVVPRLAARWIRSRALRHVHVSLQPQGLGLRSVQARRGLDGRACGHGGPRSRARNLVHRRDDVNWGPNSTFRFPLSGGTGAIWRAVSDRLPQERIHLGCRIVGIDPTRRIVVFADGRTATYDALVSTMPLDLDAWSVARSSGPDKTGGRLRPFVKPHRGCGSARATT